MDTLIPYAILAAAFGSGLLGGFFFAFSNTIMATLSRLPTPGGLAAMQSINVDVQNTLFFVAFFGTPLLGAILSAYAVMNLGSAGSPAILIGGLLAVGMFGVTVLANVPMNNVLAALDPAGAASADYWRTYLDRWTAWNHVRTFCSLGASASFLIALRASS